jgi:hypothetical protein
MGLVKIGLESVDWIHLARDSYQWRAVVNTVVTLGLYKRLRDVDF